MPFIVSISPLILASSSSYFASSWSVSASRRRLISYIRCTSTKNSMFSVSTSFYAISRLRNRAKIALRLTQSSHLLQRVFANITCCMNLIDNAFLFTLNIVSGAALGFLGFAFSFLRRHCSFNNSYNKQLF